MEPHAACDKLRWSAGKFAAGNVNGDCRRRHAEPFAVVNFRGAWCCGLDQATMSPVYSTMPRLASITASPRVRFDEQPFIGVRFDITDAAADQNAVISEPVRA